MIDSGGVTFLLGKHPYAQSAGDTRISRLLISIAAEIAPVRAICLWSGEPVDSPIDVECVAKPPPRLPRLVLRSFRDRRSLVHTRYITDELVAAVRAASTRTWFAEHSYMAEAVLAVRERQPTAPLIINAHVIESSVLEHRAATSTIGTPLRFEAERMRRDEIRCSRAAAATVCLGDADLAALRAAAVPGLSRLDLLLPPQRRAATATEPIALFVGDRGWAPNREAAAAVLELWPRIRERVPGAKLLVVGRPHPRERRPALDGVDQLGFVPDLEPVFDTAAVLLAPVAVGGGVRVKILEALARGVPVVATPEGVGSISRYLPVAPSRAPEQFVERAAELLGDRVAAADEGRRLYEASAELWHSGFVHEQVEAVLRAGGDAASPQLERAPGAAPQP